MQQTPYFLRLAVFASGGGSNFRALYHAISNQAMPCRIALFLSNNSTCGAMNFARESGIPTTHLSSKTHPDPSAYEEAMLRVLKQERIDAILLAGYMKTIPRRVIDAYPKRIVNIHPSLLPKFGGEGMYGMNVHEAVLKAKERESGATIHYVEEGYDTGELIMQQAIPIMPEDTVESLAARVLEIEHQLYPKALIELLPNWQKDIESRS